MPKRDIVLTLLVMTVCLLDLTSHSRAAGDAKAATPITSIAEGAQHRPLRLFDHDHIMASL